MDEIEFNTTGGSKAFREFFAGAVKIREPLPRLEPVESGHPVLTNRRNSGADTVRIERETGETVDAEIQVAYKGEVRSYAMPKELVEKLFSGFPFEDAEALAKQCFDIRYGQDT
ncbi:hypothetical protein [Streptomyces erythrochromogenes]|uniref:hypothetical protein n=1 Tax=Streptomyces erythrochromogenes TaxID=285574 RepID=UPI0002E971CE